MYIYVYIHIYIYAYICICMYMIRDIYFKDFVCFLVTAILSNNSTGLAGQDHIHDMCAFQQKTICSQFNYSWCSYRGKFAGK